MQAVDSLWVDEAFWALDPAAKLAFLAMEKCLTDDDTGLAELKVEVDRLIEASPMEDSASTEDKAMTLMFCQVQEFIDHELETRERWTVNR